ncbi:MAG: glycosyltransferase family 2 protein [Candidatus Omnitrophota bacterium]|jgi:hypothetical protein
MAGISIIILTYNNAAFTKRCLVSVFAQNYQNPEVIVVDNHSSDGTIEMIKRDYSQVILIENNINLGASKARNQGISVANGEWILTLDSDVVLEKDFLSRFDSLSSGFAADTAMVQPNVFSFDGKAIYSQGIYLTKFRRFYDLNRGKPDSYISPKRKKIIGPCSAAAFYRRSALNQLKENTGYFDERFFFLVEDVDLAWRASKSGWKTIFVPELKCYHCGNGSRTGKKLRRFLCSRNRILMINKNESFLGKIFVCLISLPYELPRFIFSYLDIGECHIDYSVLGNKTRVKA